MVCFLFCVYYFYMSSVCSSAYVQPVTHFLTCTTQSTLGNAFFLHGENEENHENPGYNRRRSVWDSHRVHLYLENKVVALVTTPWDTKLFHSTIFFSGGNGASRLDMFSFLYSSFTSFPIVIYYFFWPFFPLGVLPLGVRLISYFGCLCCPIVCS
jgi:hypothetical protein